MKTDNIYLARILDAAGQIGIYTRKLDFRKFKSDRKTQSAVILQLVVIGEEAKRISAKTKKLIPLPWRQVMGFRNKAVHEYFNLDLAIVWKTIAGDIPKLQKAVKDFLKTQKPSR